MTDGTSDRVLVRAQAKTVRMSARKARLVLDHLRGRPVPEARTVLAFTPRAAAREVARVLHSAVANAESAHGLHGDELVVQAAYADEGPTLKRWQARARGRVNRIRKRTCHITIVVERDPRLAAGRPKRGAKPSTEQAPVPVSATETSAEDTSAEDKPKTRRKSPAKKEVAA